MKSYLISLLTWSMTGMTSLAAPDYLQVTAQSGDGIFSLLRRYQLEQYSCNFDQFYALNKLKKNAHLRSGKPYTLPIQLYEFNGKTIRSSIGVDDWDLAVKIQEYNEAMLENAVRLASYKEDKQLWVPHHIRHCPDEKTEVAAPATPSGPGTSEQVEPMKGDRIFPIFGPDYAKTPLNSNKLKGKVFYISSGHGGPDPGAIGKRAGHDLCEDEYAYDVCLRLCRHLIAHGATAYMINRDPNDGIRDDDYFDCDEDEVLWGGVKMNYGQKSRLFQRSDIINDLYEKHLQQGVVEQTAIEVHVDSRSRSQRTDLYFYHYPGSESGEKLAKKMLATMQEKYEKYRKDGQYEGTVKGRDLHMLRELKPLSVYVEMANIRNYSDQQRIVLKKNRQLLADWLFEGLTR